jgi:hypothetical protein
MRFLAAGLLAALLLGSVAWCQYAFTRRVAVDVTRAAHGHGRAETAEAGHTYRLELTLSFAATRDPFALRTAPDGDAPRLCVRYAGAVLLEHTADIPRDEGVTLDGLALQGDAATFFVQATPAPDDARHPCALRVRLWRDDGALCDDKTVWSEGGGARVAGSVTCGLDPRPAPVDRGLGGCPP